jgi:electron transport complex protein RnfG
MLVREIGRNGLLLGLFAVCATLALAGTYLLTRDEIAAQRRAAEARALKEILPDERHDNSLLDDTLAIEDASLLGLKQPRKAYVGRLDGEVVAVILPVVAPDGYSGSIELIVGVNRDGTIAGVRVVAHRETPGLGDQVDIRKSPWIRSFEGRSLGDPATERWTVKKDHGEFDQFTGATITPRAVVAAVKRSLEYFAAHRARLLGTEQEDSGEAGNG